MLKEAVEKGGEHTKDHVYDCLIYGSMQLWVTDDACVVTSWTDYPTGRIGYVIFAGGKNVDAWICEAEDRFSEWFTLLGCKEARIIGRKGWGKKLPHLAQRVIYVKELKET